MTKSTLLASLLLLFTYLGPLGPFAVAQTAPSRLAAPADPNHVRDHILKDVWVKQLFKDDTGHSLRALEEVRHPMMRTTKYQHYYRFPGTTQDLEVVGSFVFHEETRHGHRILAHKLSRFDRIPEAVSPRLDPSRALREEQALTIARAEHEKAHDPGHTGAEPQTETIVLKIRPSHSDIHVARLVYRISFTHPDSTGPSVPAAHVEPPWNVILDALTGEVLSNQARRRQVTQSAPPFAPVPLSIFTAKGQNDRLNYSLNEFDLDRLNDQERGACQVVAGAGPGQGVPVHINPLTCRLAVRDGVVWPAADDSAKRAADQARHVLDYFRVVHGRDGLDGRHSSVTAIVHVGQSYDNAYWDVDERFLAFGDGNGKTTGDYTQALDLIAHELTHGVVAATAKLDGDDEPGALNESIADVFGVLIARRARTAPANPDWILGRDIFLDPKNAGLRSLANPHSFDRNGRVFPAKYSEKLARGAKCSPANDGCEVHSNSLIPSHAAYLIAKELGDDDTARLYYLALTQRLAARDGFKQAATDLLDICTQVYDSARCAKVRAALVATELVN